MLLPFRVIKTCKSIYYWFSFISFICDPKDYNPSIWCFIFFLHFHCFVFFCCYSFPLFNHNTQPSDVVWPHSPLPQPYTPWDALSLHLDSSIISLSPLLYIKPVEHNHWHYQTFLFYLQTHHPIWYSFHLYSLQIPPSGPPLLYFSFCPRHGKTT